MAEAASFGGTRSLLANVAGALLVPRHADPAGEADRERLAAELGELFEETLVARDDDAEDPLQLFEEATAIERSVVEGLFAVLQGARTERVLVVEPDAPLGRHDLWLALTAWPESVAVVLVASGRVVASLYSRERMIEATRSLLTAEPAGGASIARLHQSIEASVVSPADLGLVPLADSEPAPGGTC